jgi:NhaP-type Na+/H+ or K+/H+ antiporter
MLGVISLSIGVVFGFLTSLAFKHCSFIRVNPITETFLMFAFSIMSYFISNAIVINGVTMSGITSLLTCAIIQSHYTYYNLSPQGKTASTLTVTFMGTAAEAAVYSYVGIALLAQIPSWWSWEFIFAEFFLIVIGRIVAVFLTFGAFRLCCKSRTINLRELTFITYAGMIRGAIAFALVLSLPA